MGEDTSPVSKGNRSEVAEEGKVMIEVAKEAKESSRVIKLRDGRETKAR